MLSLSCDHDAFHITLVVDRAEKMDVVVVVVEISAVELLRPA